MISKLNYDKKAIEAVQERHKSYSGSALTLLNQSHQVMQTEIDQLKAEFAKVSKIRLTIGKEIKDLISSKILELPHGILKPEVC